MKSMFCSRLGFAGLVLASMSFGTAVFAQQGKPERCEPSIIKPNSSFKAKIVKLSDGDTVVVTGSKQGLLRRIRLLNIDTPETHFEGKTQGYPGDLAAAHLEKLVPVGTDVTVQYAEQPCDGYKRHLGFVFKGQLNVNLEMVKAGMALSLCFAPNLAHCKVFIDEAMEVMTTQGRFSVFKPAGAAIPPEKRKEFPALVPHEFRYESSFIEESDFVGDWPTKKATTFEHFKKIKNPLHRIFFIKKEDIAGAGFQLVP